MIKITDEQLKTANDFLVTVLAAELDSVQTLEAAEKDVLLAMNQLVPLGPWRDRPIIGDACTEVIATLERILTNLAAERVRRIAANLKFPSSIREMYVDR